DGERAGDNGGSSPFVFIEPGEVIGEHAFHRITDLPGDLGGGADIEQRAVARRRTSEQRVGLAAPPCRQTQRDQRDNHQGDPYRGRPPGTPGGPDGPLAGNDLLADDNLRWANGRIIQGDRTGTVAVLVELTGPIGGRSPTGDPRSAADRVGIRARTLHRLVPPPVSVAQLGVARVLVAAGPMGTLQEPGSLRRPAPISRPSRRRRHLLSLAGHPHPSLAGHPHPSDASPAGYAGARNWPARRRGQPSRPLR